MFDRPPPLPAPPVQRGLESYLDAMLAGDRFVAAGALALDRTARRTRVRRSGSRRALRNIDTSYCIIPRGPIA